MVPSPFTPLYHLNVFDIPSGVKRNEEGILEEEENFEEAVKAVNTALNPTRVSDKSHSCIACNIYIYIIVNKDNFHLKLELTYRLMNTAQISE